MHASPLFNKNLRSLLITVMLMLIAPAMLHAATRVTYKSAKSTSSTPTGRIASITNCSES